MSVRDIIAEAIRDEPYIDHGEPPSAEQYADAVINELHRHGYTIGPVAVRNHRENA